MALHVIHAKAAFGFGHVITNIRDGIGFLYGLEFDVVNVDPVVGNFKFQFVLAGLQSRLAAAYDGIRILNVADFAILLNNPIDTPFPT